MAQTAPRFQANAKLVQDIMNLVTEARERIKVCVETHDGVDFTGAVAASGTWAPVSADGNLKGFTFSAQAYLDAIAFCKELEKLMTNQAPAQGFWNTKVALVISPAATQG